MNLNEIKVNAKEVKESSAGGQAAYTTLLEALASKEGYSMRTVDALELLYPGDTRPADNIKNSFATAKSHCFSKANWRVEYTDPQKETIAIVGKRAEGAEGAKGMWNPIV